MGKKKYVYVLVFLYFFAQSHICQAFCAERTRTYMVKILTISVAGLSAYRFYTQVLNWNAASHDYGWIETHNSNSTDSHFNIEEADSENKLNFSSNNTTSVDNKSRNIKFMHIPLFASIFLNTIHLLVSLSHWGNFPTYTSAELNRFPELLSFIYRDQIKRMKTSLNYDVGILFFNSLSVLVYMSLDNSLPEPVGGYTNQTDWQIADTDYKNYLQKGREQAKISILCTTGGIVGMVLAYKLLSIQFQLPRVVPYPPRNNQILPQILRHNSLSSALEARVPHRIFTEEKECSICLEKFTETDPMSSAPHFTCGHQGFHENCIVNSIEHGFPCPICRSMTGVDEI